MKAKYANGTRVITKLGHGIWSANEYTNGMTINDIRPELTKDFATVIYTYGEKSETDPRFGKGEEGYKQYALKFDNYGEIAWFEEKNLIPVYYYEGKPYRVLHEGKVKATSIMAKCLTLIDGKPISEKELSAGSIQLRKVNNDSLWIDVVVYEPLYAECDIRVCVKEKEDFYNNYKSTV